MPETILESVLNGKIDITLLKRWLNNESIDDAPEGCVLHCCKVDDFVAYFLSYLRNQTDRILQTNANVAQILQNSTPEKLLSRKHHRSVSDPTVNEHTDSLSVRSEGTSHSPSRDRKKTGRRVKTKLFSDDKKDATSSDDSRLSLSVDRSTHSISNISVEKLTPNKSSKEECRLNTSVDRISSSTPNKNGVKLTDYPNVASPVTPKNYNERCDTPRLSHRRHEKSCLGDYLVTATKSSKKKSSKKNVSSDKEEKTELDLSNSEIFPEIGARKSSSLRSEKRRIKPTNIDKSQKSLSLNSFTTECFPSLHAFEDNSAFKHQNIQPKELSNSFEAERNILRQERHKLMEKFNILNTTPQKQTTPQIKVTQKESVDVKQVYVKADVNKVLMKDKLDLLLDLYDSMFKNNLILSVNTEIYFLISILLSNQTEDDYLDVELKINDINMYYLLKSIHNSTYFAVKALWNERGTLEVILDKNSLKTLGENKNVRSFYPELAKFLLNTYCVRCEGAPVAAPAAPRPPLVVCYNIETDNIDNFTNMHAFHNFKKQRDMFYEIVRWYVGGCSAPPSLRARCRALVGCGGSAGHLAALFTHHMITVCAHNGQESKLSKLQRRLTCPTGPESNRLPHFTANELFYKDFIIYAESDSFRSHLKDTLSTEILMLDSTHLSVEDKGNANPDTCQEYLQLIKKLCLLAKFLGYLTSLPYSHTQELTSKNNHVIVLNKDNNKPPKEKVLENSIALRDYSQPSIDLKAILQNAIDNCRLAITLPWIVQYLSMLDYTTLRLNYYTEIAKKLNFIYKNKLRTSENLKKNTVIYLKSILGWLFDLPQYPIDLHNRTVSFGSESVDCIDLVDDSIILELCPNLKDLNTLLSTCRLNVERKDGSFRHITPVSLNVNAEDRIMNKEKELQSRLQAELVRSQPSSTRRIIELISERICATTVKEIIGNELATAQRNTRQLVANDEQTQQVFKSQLQELRRNALENSKKRIFVRSRDALSALLPNAPEHLIVVAYRSACNRLSDWLDTHWNNTAILCKDINIETPCVHETPPNNSGQSLAAHIIHLKEHICLVLEDVESTCLPPLLQTSITLANAGGLARKPIAQLTVDLCLVYVAKKPSEVTEAFLNQLHAVWNTLSPDRKRSEPEELTLPERREGLSPELRNFDEEEKVATPISSDEDVQPTNVVNLTTNPVNLTTNQANLTTNQVNLTTNQVNLTTNQVNLTTNPVNLTTNQVNCVINATNVGNTTNLITKHVKATSLVNLTNSGVNTTKQINNATNTVNLATSVNKTNQLTIKTERKTNYKSKSIPNSPTYFYNKTSNSKSIPTSPINLIPTYTRTVVNNKLINSNSVNNICANVNNKTGSVNNKSGSVNNKSVNSVCDIDESDVLLDFFNRILCPRNIGMLSASRCDQRTVWECLAKVLVFLLKNNYLSEDSLTEQCLAVYRQDWPQTILESLSSCMKTVSTNWSRSSVGKFTLFLDFLAEYCGDMDYEPND